MEYRITKKKGYFMKGKAKFIEKPKKKKSKKELVKAALLGGAVLLASSKVKKTPVVKSTGNKREKEKAVSVEKSNLLFEFPSLHGEKGKFVHLVVGSDLVDAAMRLAKARYLEKFLEPAKEKDPEGYEENKESFGPDGEIGYKRVALSAGDYIVRALIEKLQGTPTDQEPGVVEINHENKLAS